MKKISFVLVISLILILMCGCVTQTGQATEISPIDTQPRTESVSASDTISEEYAVQLSPREEKLSFLCAGDNIVYMGQIREAAANAKADGNTDAEHDFTPMYKNVADIIASYDISFVNQETVMAGEGYDFSAYPSFNSPTELGENLVSVGFDIINIATNHMLDMGRQGLSNTIDFWNTQNVLMVGGYTDEEDFYDIRTIQKNGITIAVGGFTYHPKNVSGTTPYIPTIDDERITKWITLAKQKSDLVVVSVHWGYEYRQDPNAEQERLAQLMADAGADVIIGHHTHCLQPIEWIEGKGGNKALCFYSLGNFTSQTDETVSLPGGFATFDIIYNERDGISIENVGFIPTVMDYRSSFNKNTVYLLEDYTDEQCRSHGIVTYFRQTLSVDILREYVSNAIDEKYLPQSYLDAEN